MTMKKATDLSNHELIQALRSKDPKYLWLGQDGLMGVVADRFDNLLKSRGHMPDTAPYAPHNESSKDAAKNIELKMTALRTSVLSLIRSKGSHGATGSEVSEILKINLYTAKPRCTELFKAGYIANSGLKRVNANGNNETVWIAV